MAAAVDAAVPYPRPLVEAALVRRYKRFLAEVRLADGAVVTAHCPNPGRMTSCLAPEAPCRLLPSDDPRRRLAWTLEQVRVDGTWIGVNPQRANAVVAAGIAAGLVPSLAGLGPIAREVAPEPGTRFDLRLGPACWVEVKQVTLRVEPGRGAFPDAVSERALRHLAALRARVEAGERAALLFAVARADVDVVEPADAVDPRYGVALRAAAAAGVELLAYRVEIRADGLCLAEPLAIDLRQP